MKSLSRFSSQEVEGGLNTRRLQQVLGLGGSCHAGTPATGGTFEKKVVLVGSPNVGKSVIFNTLTGARVTVSNYPGTTVEISRGRAKLDSHEYEVVDTPGMYSLLPVSEDERVTRSILLEDKPDVVLHVVDARNIRRMLPLTLQLAEAKLPVMLVLNMMDEVERSGMELNARNLERELRIPVVTTEATRGRGIENLRSRMGNYDQGTSGKEVTYDNFLEEGLSGIESLLKKNYTMSKRAVGLLLLQGDAEMENRVREGEGQRYDAIKQVMSRTRSGYGQSVRYVVASKIQQESRRMLSTAIAKTGTPGQGFMERISRAMMNPLTGIPLLLVVLFLLYEVVGVFGAQIAVDFLETTVFGNWINPWIAGVVRDIIPWQIVQDLFVGDYGVITLGLTYAVAIILPIVGTFFIFFSIIEDSGYLPRLSMLLDRVFKGIGLSGKAVIPMVLGFGCDTMATIVTRTQETRRERLITTLLLALAVPCSAQLGVIFGLLSGNIQGLLIWGGVVTLIFLLVGYLASRVIPGRRPAFYMEIPPLRAPRLSNVLIKTYTRMQWFFIEVLPLFIIASLLLWTGKLTGILELVVKGLEPLVGFLGLPPETAFAFLYGFFRRDFGAAGLYDLNSAGVLTGVPLVVAAVTLTLFMPCIAQTIATIRERGVKTALGIILFIFPFAFIVGFILNSILTISGVSL